MLSRPPTRWRKLNMAISTLVRNANPVLFSVTMGTGAVSMLFAAFPYGKGSKGMMAASLSWLLLNLALFSVFFAISAAKYFLYPDRWTALVSNPVTSLFLGTFPMGATTILNAAVEVINVHFEFGGKPFLYFIWALWWVVVIISASCFWIGVHAMFVKQKHALSTMTAAWLLPVVTLIVAASTGGVIATALHRYSARYALITVVASVFLVSTGLALAMMVLTIYYARLIIHGLPQGVSIVSVFLPLGPTGQAGYAIGLIGNNFRKILPYKCGGASLLLNSQTSGDIIYVIATCTSFVLWSLATMWMIYALLALRSTLFKTSIGFRMTFWGLVFPNGVYANLTLLLGNSFDSPALRIYGSIYAVVVVCLWIGIAVRSLFAMNDLLNKHKDLVSDSPMKEDISETPAISTQMSRFDMALPIPPSVGSSITGVDMDCVTSPILK